MWLRVAGCGWVSGVRLGEGLGVGLSSTQSFRWDLMSSTDVLAQTSWLKTLPD